MKVIKEYVDLIDEELCGAKCYAEKYLYQKALGNTQHANYYMEMANDELQHASHLHEIAVTEVEKLKEVYKPTPEMQEAWSASHTKYVETMAFIKQMLAM